MADATARFVVLPLFTVMGTRFETFEDAETQAGKRVEVDGLPHVIVRIEGEARRRMVPNVSVTRFDAPEVANG